MAITAYNHGLQGMRRAMAMRKAATKQSIRRMEAASSSLRPATFTRNLGLLGKSPETIVATSAIYTLTVPPSIVKSCWPAMPPPWMTWPAVSMWEVADFAGTQPGLARARVSRAKYVPKGYRLRLPLKDGRDGGAQRRRRPSRDLSVGAKTQSILHRPEGRHGHSDRQGSGHRLRASHCSQPPGLAATVYVNQNLRLPLSGEKRLELAQAESPGARTREAEASGRVADTRSEQTSGLEATAEQSAGAPSASAERPTSKPAATVEARSAAEENAVNRIYALAAP